MWILYVWKSILVGNLILLRKNVLVEGNLLLFFVVVVFENIGIGFWLRGSRLLCLFLIVCCFVGFGLNMLRGRLFRLIVNEFRLNIGFVLGFIFCSFFFVGVKLIENGLVLKNCFLKLKVFLKGFFWLGLEGEWNFCGELGNFL